MHETPSTDRPAICVSACLLGRNVRYDGSHKLDPCIAEALGNRFALIPVCPEVQCGMPVPREPLVVSSGPSNRIRLLGNVTGEDYTSRMMEWTEEWMRVTLKGPAPVAGFIFKARSPSCACSGSQAGLFAGEVIRRYPLLPVMDEEEFRDGRDSFLSRAVAYYGRRRL